MVTGEKSSSTLLDWICRPEDSVCFTVLRNTMFLSAERRA